MSRDTDGEGSVPLVAGVTAIMIATSDSITAVKEYVRSSLFLTGGLEYMNPAGL